MSNKNVNKNTGSGQKPSTNEGTKPDVNLVRDDGEKATEGQTPKNKPADTPVEVVPEKTVKSKVKTETRTATIPKPVNKALLDEQTASLLKRKHGVKVVYQAGKYWFTNKTYAEQSAKTQDVKIKTFD